MEEFTRSTQQNIDLGLYSSEALQEASQEERLERVAEGGKESSSDEESEEDGDAGAAAAEAGGAEGGGASVMGTKAQQQALRLLFDSSSKPDVAKEVQSRARS